VWQKTKHRKQDMMNSLSNVIFSLNHQTQKLYKFKRYVQDFHFRPTNDINIFTLKYFQLFSLFGVLPSLIFIFFLWVFSSFSTGEGVILCHFWPKITPLHLFFFLAFNLNKWFSHRLNLLIAFFYCYFVVLVRRCVVRRLGAVLCCSSSWYDGV
jgi:hypothetical protein